MAVTLANMRDAGKDLCDMVNNSQVSDATWNRWINDGIEKLYRICSKVNVGAFQKSSTTTLTSASNLIPKPADFRRLLGVSLDPTVPSMRRSLSKYMFGQRDARGLLGPRAYHVIGQNIAIEPIQICAGNYGIYYISGPTILVADADPIDVILEPYDDYVTTWAAIKASAKEESDNRDLYEELKGLAQDIAEMFAALDGDDAETIVDDDLRGPTFYSPP